MRRVNIDRVGKLMDMLGGETDMQAELTVPCFSGSAKPLMMLPVMRPKDNRLSRSGMNDEQCCEVLHNRLFQTT